MSFDVPMVLDLLGIELTNEFTSGWGKALCPFHNDTTPSFGINLDDGRWVCRAYCGQGNLVQLVSKTLKIPLTDAFQWLTRSGSHLKPISSETMVSKLKMPDADEHKGVPFDFDGRRVPKFIVDRGFSMSELKRWRMSYDTDSGAAVLPLDSWYIKRNPPGDPLKYYYPTEMPKSRLLFGLDMVEGSTLTIVEGPLDAIWMHQKGYRDTVSIMGMSLSPTQADIINKRFTDVTLFLDNDPAGRVGTYNAIPKLKCLLSVATLPLGIKDPPEASDEQIAEAMANKIPALEWIIRTMTVRSTDAERVRKDRKEEHIGLEELLFATRTRF